MGRKKGTTKKATAAGVDIVEIEKELEPERASAEQCLRFFSEAPLTREELAAWLIKVKGERDRIKERLDTFRRPLADLKKAVDSLFKPVLDTLEACDGAINRRLGEQTVAARAALTAVAGGARDEATLAAAHAPADAPDGLVEQTTYQFEIVSESEIPRSFLTFDEALARKFVKHHKGQCEIPGVKILAVVDYKRAPGAGKAGAE